jgi:acetoin utilization protein AcuB
MSSGKIIGVLSDRDIRTARAMPGADLDKTLVRYFCHENPYVVEPDDSLHDVAGEMALRHYGCAIIARNGKLVGIFTTVDACRTIAILLEQGL